jgi:hypothetical protein
MKFMPVNMANEATLPQTLESALYVLRVIDWWEHGIYSENAHKMSHDEAILHMSDLIDAGVLLPANGRKPVRLSAQYETQMKLSQHKKSMEALIEEQDIDGKEHELMEESGLLLAKSLNAVVHLLPSDEARDAQEIVRMYCQFQVKLDA